jgi:hypothetical protein
MSQCCFSRARPLRYHEVNHQTKFSRVRSCRNYHSCTTHLAAADLVALQRPAPHCFSSATSLARSHAGGLIILFLMLLQLCDTCATVCRSLYRIPATLGRLVDSPITLHHRTLTAATLYVYSRSVGHESLNLYTIDLPASVCVRTCHWDNM